MSDQLQFPLGEPDDSKPEPPYNLLPHQGDAIYHGRVYEADVADTILTYLLEKIPWQHDEAMIYGKHIVTARKVAWYGDSEYDYTYSGKTRRAQQWNAGLFKLKLRVEELTGVAFNSCLLNLYADGDQGMGWHSDDEKCLGKDTTIASLSFGAERRFDFRHKVSKEKHSVQLEHGSLLVMQGATQSHWQHQIPKTKKVKEPRVNLTFRTMIVE